MDQPGEADVCWAVEVDRSALIKAAKEKGIFINQFPEDDVLLTKDLLVSLMHSTYRCFSKNASDVLPESYFVNTQLPAFMGRYKELEADDLASVWKVASSSSQQVFELPYLGNDLDWLLRLSESNTLLQRYQRRPFLLEQKKTTFRFTLMVKSVVPLQAFVSKKVTMMSALSNFTMAQVKLGDARIHECSEESKASFNDVEGHDAIHSRAVD